MKPATADEKRGSVRIEDGMAVIRMPMSDVHGMCVALAECPCRAPKSHATKTIRQRLATALARLSTQNQPKRG